VLRSSNTDLKDEEPIVVEVDALLPQELQDLLDLGPASVDLVVRRVVLEAGSGDDESRVWDFAITFFVLSVAVVDDLLEEDLDGARSENKRQSGLQESYR